MDSLALAIEDSPIGFVLPVGKQGGFPMPGNGTVARVGTVVGGVVILPLVAGLMAACPPLALLALAGFGTVAAKAVTKGDLEDRMERDGTAERLERDNEMAAKEWLCSGRKDAQFKVTSSITESASHHSLPFITASHTVTRTKHVSRLFNYDFNLDDE